VVDLLVPAFPPCLCHSLSQSPLPSPHYSFPSPFPVYYLCPCPRPRTVLARSRISLRLPVARLRFPHPQVSGPSSTRWTRRCLLVLVSLLSVRSCISSLSLLLLTNGWLVPGTYPPPAPVPATPLVPSLFPLLRIPALALRRQNGCVQTGVGSCIGSSTVARLGPSPSPTPRFHAPRFLVVAPLHCSSQCLCPTSQPTLPGSLNPLVLVVPRLPFPYVLPRPPLSSESVPSLR